MDFLDFMSPIDYILPGLILAGVIFAFTFGRDWGKNWKGFGRLMISIPLAGMAAVPLNISIGTAIDPKSHNLGPIELIVWCGGFFIWFLVVFLLGLFIRRITRPTVQPPEE